MTLSLMAPDNLTAFAISAEAERVCSRARQKLSVDCISLKTYTVGQGE